MSKREDEQHEDVKDSHSSSEDKESSGDEFSGWETGPRLQYRVDSDSEGRVQLIPDIASENRTEDLLDKSLQEIDETWQDLGAIADRLGELSPRPTEDAEWELAFFNKEKSDRSQGATAVSRESLVSKRISLFEGLVATTTATMSLTTATTLTTTTTTTTVAGSSIMSTGISTASDMYGLSHLGATSQLQENMEGIMKKLEFEVKFTVTELEE